MGTDHELAVKVRTLAGFAGVRPLVYVSGVPEAAVRAATAGRPVSDAAADRLRAVDLYELSGRVSQVYAGGLALRVRALQAQGWFLRDIAGRIGLRENYTHPFTLASTGRSLKVRSHIWRALYTEGPAMFREWPQKEYADRTARDARARGYRLMAELEEDILDLAEPWRTEEIERRAREHMAGPDFRPRTVQKLDERSEVLYMAMRLHRRRLDMESYHRRKEAAHG